MLIDWEMWRIRNKRRKMMGKREVGVRKNEREVWGKKIRGCQGEIGWFGGGVELVLGKEIKPSWKEGHLLVLWPWIMQI
jgi:hypothetical protein